MKKCQKRRVTLIEIIIVIFLIGLIAGVVGYNVTGTFEKGKAFATEQGIERLHNILEIAIAENPSLSQNLESNWKQIVKDSPLVKNPDALTHDGWGKEYELTLENGQIVIRSTNLEKYQRGEGR